MERYHEKKNDYYIFKYKHIAVVLFIQLYWIL